MPRFNFYSLIIILFPLFNINAQSEANFGLAKTLENNYVKSSYGINFRYDYYFRDNYGMNVDIKMIFPKTRFGYTSGMDQSFLIFSLGPVYKWQLFKYLSGYFLINPAYFIYYREWGGHANYFDPVIIHEEKIENNFGLVLGSGIYLLNNFHIAIEYDYVNSNLTRRFTGQIKVGEQKLEKRINMSSFITTIGLSFAL